MRTFPSGWLPSKRIPRFSASWRASFAVFQDGGVEARVLNEGFPDGEPAPGRGEVEFGALVGDLQGPEDLAHQRGDEFLGERHEVLVGGIGHVEFHHGEFGVVQR